MEQRWIPTQWQYVMRGDRVRIGTSEETVVEVKTCPWLVRPGTGTSGWNPPVRDPWLEVTVILGKRAPLSFMGENPIEVLMSRERCNILVLMQAFPQTQEI